MERIKIIGLVIALILIPVLALNCASDGHEDEDNNTDNTPPIILGITVTNITNTTATISWTTDEPATCNIEYGPDTSYGYSYPSPCDTAADKTSHSLTLSDLSHNTNYYFKVKSTDVAGNESTSGDHNFTTSLILLPVATLLGYPTGKVNYGNANIIVGSSGVVSYKYKLDNDTWSTEIPVSTHITISDLAYGQHTVSVIGRDTTGNWQTEALSTKASWMVDAVVIFPDTNLEAAIRLAIGKSQGDLYQSDLLGLTEFSACCSNITNLAGIEHCTNLTSLELYSNQINNLSPISSLTNLTKLGLGSNQISNISSLSPLTGLTWLDLSCNQISDIESLVNNLGLGEGDTVYLDLNPLSNTSVNTGIPILKARGVSISYIDSTINMGKIVFCSNRDGNKEIYIMNADGTNQTRLTDNAFTDANPKLSADGRRIVFDSDRDGNLEIYIMNVDGTDQKRLTNNAFVDIQPAWSPDCTKIAFSSTRSGTPQIWVMNADGDDPLQLTIDPYPDNQGGWSVRCYTPDWSYDGMRIAFRSIVFTNLDDISVINADGSNLVTIVSGGGMIPSITEPAWSPDNIHIAVSRTAIGEAQGYNGRIMSIDSSGSNGVFLSSTNFDYAPSYSPDGSKIVFYSSRDGNNEIYIVNADGSGETRLTNNAADDSFPSWGPAIS